jgi:hypothetical protein
MPSIFGAIVVSSSIATTVALSAHAEPAEAARTEPHGGEVARLEVGMQAFVLTTVSDVCSRTADVQSCESGASALGLGIVPRYRFLPWLSLGALAAYGTNPATQASVSSGGGPTTEYATRFWRLGAQGRVHPWGLGKIEPWLCAEAGLAAFTNLAETFQGGRSIGSVSDTQLAPSLGVGIGIDFLVLNSLALGIESRGLTMFFKGGDPQPTGDSDTDRRYGTQLGVWLGLNATIVSAL